MRKIVVSSRTSLLGILASVSIFFAPCTQAQAAGPIDEAQRVNRDVASFPQAKEDYFRDMDNGVPLSADEVQGRNMWLLWTGGNDIENSAICRGQNSSRAFPLRNPLTI